jgi:hypothetical protein
VTVFCGVLELRLREVSGPAGLELRGLPCSEVLPWGHFGAVMNPEKRVAVRTYIAMRPYRVPHLFCREAACYGIGMPTAPDVTRVNNHFPSIFLASPSRSTWLFAVQKGRPVAGFKDTSK